MEKHVVIVGAGTAGLMLANSLARALPDEAASGRLGLTLVGADDTYTYQPGFLYVAFGLMHPSELRRPVADILAPSVRFVHERVQFVDVHGQSVVTDRGRTLHYDYLVLATGSQANWREVPGLADGAHTFYTLEGALRLQEALKRFTGGRIVLAVGVPHKCPVAPLEFTFMLDDWLKRRGIRSKTEIVYTYPIGRVHSIPECAAWADGEFQARAIRSEVFFNPDRVEPAAGRLQSVEGTTLEYDLLVAVPPHSGDELGERSGLVAEGNWYPTDPRRLTLKGHDNVFVLGDATNLPVSKAGSVAHYEAEVVAANLTELLRGADTPAVAYDGKVFCFVEAGLDRATYIHFDYEHPPTLAAPTASVHWFKQLYNRIHWLNLKAVI